MAPTPSPSSSLPYTLHRATPADLETILSLLRNLGAQHVAFDPARWAMTPGLPDAYLHWLTDNHDTGHTFCLLARSAAGEPLGYVLAEAMPEDAKYFTGPHAYIHDIYLLPEARGTGLARAFVDHVRTWANARGLSQFRALIATQNTQSLAFFAKLGFRPTATEVSAEFT